MTRSLLLLATAGLALAACHKEGAYEKAGEQADKAAGIHDTALTDGPGEKAGRSIDKAMREDAKTIKKEGDAVADKLEEKADEVRADAKQEAKDIQK